MPQPEGLPRAALLRRATAVAVLVLVVTVLAVVWWGSRLGTYSVVAMGHVVDGRSAVPVGHQHLPTMAGSVSVTDLVADPARPADVRVTLEARRERILIPRGQAVDGYTIGGSSPGPVIRARQGQLVEVTLVNESVPDGVALHWHGVDVPNAEDGVAGITQDAVPIGGRHVYRFVAADAGTYWYHSHQMSHEQVELGLFGALVVEPVTPVAATEDRLALLHLYAGQRTLNGRAEDEVVEAAPGSAVRVRVVNTDQGTAAVWASGPFRVVATDGHDVTGPTDVEAQSVLVAAGGRIDLEMTSPRDGSATRLRLGGRSMVVVPPGGSAASAPEPAQPRDSLDLMTYGSPQPTGIDTAHPDRVFDYVIGRRFGLIDGRPGSWWTINGHLFPDVPMFHVRLGDVVTMRIENQSDEVHPMHLHGHHVVVLSRNGARASGSPWWVDSLDVQPGEAYEVAFVADNPGIWSDHCHTLPHAVEGLVAHVMYEGVTTPYLVAGSAGNHPE
ncbi:MAG TPA: multicopper oxidase family protein [Lapillicoccus sp.]